MISLSGSRVSGLPSIRRLPVAGHAPATPRFGNLMAMWKHQEYTPSLKLFHAVILATCFGGAWAGYAGIQESKKDTLNSFSPLAVQLYTAPKESPMPQDALVITGKPPENIPIQPGEEVRVTPIKVRTKEGVAFDKLGPWEKELFLYKKVPASDYGWFLSSLTGLIYGLGDIVLGLHDLRRKHAPAKTEGETPSPAAPDADKDKPAQS